MIYPRCYQNECVDVGFNYYTNGGIGNQLWALPTGTGKSLIPAMFMHRAMTQYPQSRFLVLTHVKELVKQNFEAMRLVWPVAPVSIFSAGLGVKEAHAPIVSGGIASVVKAIPQIGFRDILFIDEAHLLSPNDSSMYQKAIEQLRQYNPLLKVIGLTATPFRMGQGRLTDSTYDSDGKPVPAMFTDTTFDITSREPFNRLIDEYYLSPLIPKRTENYIDCRDVEQLANDFNQTQLMAAVETQGVTGEALQEAYEQGKDRKSWIVFGAGIKNCLQIKDILNRMGVPTVAVHSNRENFKMSDDERDKAITAFKAGRFRAIVSNNILTTGFNHPAVDFIIDLRPTTSIPLHIQKYGRGTRPVFHPAYTHEHLQHKHFRQEAIGYGGKQNCLVMDFAGNTARLGPINDPQIPSRKKGGGTGEVPVKICENCGAYNHTVARVCVECGHEFIFKEKIKPTASTREIIAKGGDDIKYKTVTNMIPRVHKKNGKPPTLQISYFCGVALYRVWLGFEGKGLGKHKAREWWRQHQGDDIPETTQEAFNRFSECRQTGQLRVDLSGKHPEILEYLF